MTSPCENAVEDILDACLDRSGAHRGLRRIAIRENRLGLPSHRYRRFGAERHPGHKLARSRGGDE